MYNVNLKRKDQGFTFIELLILFSIVGIFAAVGYSAYDDYVQNKKAESAFDSLSTYRMSVAMCYKKNNSFKSCDSGQNGIPNGFDKDDQKFKYIENIYVSKGVISSRFLAKDKNENNIDVVLIPDFQDGKMDWEVKCSDINMQSKDSYIDECTTPLK